MKIALHQTGGVFGVDRRVEIDDDRVLVSQAGTAPWVRNLDRGTAENMERLAESVLSVEPQEVQRAGDVVDRLSTRILIVDDHGREHRLEVGAGDDAPDIVWDFVDAVVRCADVGPLDAGSGPD